jgi:hypothetical protein
MKVLVASNYLHTVPGGGEVVFLQTQALLRQRGHQVVPFAVGEDRSLDSMETILPHSAGSAVAPPRVSNVYARHADYRMVAPTTAS